MWRVPGTFTGGNVQQMIRSIVAGFALGALQFALAGQPCWAAPSHVVDGRIYEFAPALSQEAVAYQINVGHSGNIAFTTPLTPPLKQLWTINLGGLVSYPLIADGMAYVVVNCNELFALNLTTGQTVWEKLLSGGWNAAAFDGNSLFDVSDGGQLLAMSATTGAPEWDIQLPGQWSFSSPPTAQNGMVFTSGAGEGGTLYGVNETTGALTWYQEVANGDDSSPALGDGGVFVAYPCQYYGFAPTTGNLLWNYNGGCDGGGGETPVYFSNNVYVADTGNGNYVLDAATGKQTGSFGGLSAPAFFTASNQITYMLTISDCSNGANCSLFCTNTSTGNVAWSFVGDGALEEVPIVVNGLVVVASTAGHLYVLNGITGKQSWSGTLPAGVQTAMAAGLGTVVVPAGATLTAFVSQ